MTNTHPRHLLDETIASPVRFSIMATLAGIERAEFALVRDTVEISDATLSKQASALESAGYVRIHKGYVGKRPRTWLSLTTHGRAAFARQLETLQAIAALQPGIDADS